MRAALVCLLVCVPALLLTPRSAHADSAEVLPKGVARVHANTKFYLPIDKRYNPDGDSEDLAADFNARLNSNVFPALGLVESAFGLPRGFATVGDSVVSFELDITQLELGLQYGLTDRLTLGVFVPYWWVTNNVKARLDTSTATVGKSAALRTLAPLGFLDSRPLTTEDIQSLLGPGLDIDGNGRIDIPGFGFKRFETWSDQGFGDLEAGFRYQYLKTQDWRLAFSGGARFPTGQVDDPDSLVDFEFGDGAYAVLFRFNNDYTGIPNLVLNGTFRYDLIIPDKETKRVPGDVNQPITTNKEKVSRDLGDIFEFEVSATYSFWKGFSLSGLYQFGFKLKDQVSGDRGFAYESLENETNYTEHVAIVALSYSTVPRYTEKTFPIPLTASLAYRNRFAGSNNVLKSQYIALSLAVLF